MDEQKEYEEERFGCVRRGCRRRNRRNKSKIMRERGRVRREVAEGEKVG